MENYDGALAIERAWREGLTPDPVLTVSQWADRHRLLSPKASSEPGRWRTSRTPYLQAIMDCLSPTSIIERIVLMAGSQLGKTECGNNWIGYPPVHCRRRSALFPVGDGRYLRHLFRAGRFQ